MEALGLGEVVGKKKRRGRPVLITTNWVVGERGGRSENLFHEPERRPTTSERRLMFALLMELMILRVMDNHVYSFNGVKMIQQEGGPIGLKLSGAIAKVVMLSWSKKFKACVSTALSSFDYFQLYMLLFYVDDTGHIAPRGAKKEEAFGGVILKSERPSGALFTNSGPPFFTVESKIEVLSPLGTSFH